jgi:hypothetical protein
MRTLKGQLLGGLMASLALCLGACGGGTEAGGAVTAPPTRSGEVWAVQSPDDRTAVAGSIVAFVNGVHVMVVDGEQIYAGMTELTTKEAAGGGRTIAFPSGLSADLVPSGQGAELRFSTGEKVAVGSRQ